MVPEAIHEENRMPRDAGLLARLEVGSELEMVRKKHSRKKDIGLREERSFSTVVASFRLVVCRFALGTLLW